MLMIPSLTQVNDQAFLADDTLIGGYELGGGWLRVERVKIGKRAFVGNSGMAAPGPQGAQGVAGRGAVGGAAPQDRARRASRGSAARRPRCGARPQDSDVGRTYDPPTRLKVARALRRGRAGSCPWRISAGARRRRGDRARRAARPAVRRAARRWSSPARCWPSAGLVAALRHRGREVAARRPAPARRPPAVELVRVAQRAGRHLRRGGGRAVVRPARSRAPRCSTSGSG